MDDLMRAAYRVDGGGSITGIVTPAALRLPPQPPPEDPFMDEKAYAALAGPPTPWGPKKPVLNWLDGVKTPVQPNGPEIPLTPEIPPSATMPLRLPSDSTGRGRLPEPPKPAYYGRDTMTTETTNTTGRAWIVLIEKQIPHQYVEINPYKKERELLELNPRGLVPTLGLVDVMLAPWAKRLFLIDHYKPGGVGIPIKGERRADEAVWARWDEWFDAVVERESVKKTWSDEEKYIEVYKRRSLVKIGRKHGGPRPGSKGKHFDDFDGVDDLDDFRVQGKSRHSKPKKNKRNRRKMGQDHSHGFVSEDTPAVTLSDRSVTAVADYIKNGPVRRIVVMTGAGISTAAGIPDFRSPETGLYANLAALDLPEPEAVFDLTFFRTNPRPFYALEKLLHMLFTQNIDCLERVAGVPAERIVEAHGSFASQRCIDCKHPFGDEEMRVCVNKGEVPRCGKEGCGGLVKPDIVFFGEQLPKDFFDRMPMTEEADLVLVMGTSLQVHPFAGLPNMASENVPRVLFNLEQVGSLGTQADDVLVLGDCDAGVRKLADALGWREELEKTWKELVGEEEAERQLQGAKKRVATLQDEVEKLADEVEEVLHIDECEHKGHKHEKDQGALATGSAAAEPAVAEPAGAPEKTPAAKPEEEPLSKDGTSPSNQGVLNSAGQAERRDRPDGVQETTGKTPL
ncbi:Sir2 histone deacetylase Hst2 [Collariella sp. IMI 366227]|nr:Sir2 histone deacetylase Hst2 [Collariella sp. IMI 366227]